VRESAADNLSCSEYRSVRIPSEIERKILILCHRRYRSVIVRDAVAKGHEVVALVRSKANAADLAGVERIEGDARQPSPMTAC
jgi:hypothetical protein